jgi:predicted DNA-binding protein with PD1-like motif
MDSMKIVDSKQSTVVILKRGDELLDCLNRYSQEQSLSGAWLLSGLGGADSATISFYDLTSRQYVDKVFNEPLEIVSLQGNLAWIDNSPFWHIHGVFGTRDYQSISGHVKSLTIALTGELLILPLETAFTRLYDEETGLKLLN